MNVCVDHQQTRQAGGHTVGGRSRLNYSDLEYFQIHKAGFSTGLLIGEPAIGRILSRTIVRFSRRLDAEDGSFDGVAVVIVEPDYLTSFHDDASLAEGNFISVRFADKTLLEATTQTQDNESYYRDNPVYEQTSGVVEERSEKFTDDQARFVAWKKLEKYPLVAIAALSTKNAFSAYELTASNYLGFAGTGSVFLLKAAALRLQPAVRASDHVVRLGGDEFTVILQHVEAIEHVSRVARLLVETIGEPFVHGGSSGNYVNASIGISLFPDDGKTGDTLLKHADIAMYAAKSAGKGCYRFYQPYLSDALILRLTQESALRQAIDQNEFIIHYQPRVDMRSGKLSSVEALVRWAPPDRGLVYPLEFIHLAEDSGMIAQLGELVAEEACAQLANWRWRGLPIIPVSVNVLARQLVSESFSAFMQGCTARHGIDPSLVEIELTESVMIDQDPTLLQELAKLRALGFKLSVDDFGTGYSSLAQPQRLHIAVLKVDPPFTKSLGKDKEAQALFKAVVSMAHALGMNVVAEDVETEEQLVTLRALSCREV